LTAPMTFTQTWAMDFINELLCDASRSCLLALLVEEDREGLDISTGVLLPSRRVVQLRDGIVGIHDYPSVIRVENDSEFAV